MQVYYATGVTDERLQKLDFTVNQYVYLPWEDLACRFDGKGLVPLRLDRTPKGLKALNIEQRCAFDLLASPNIKTKVLDGPAGTGKTKIALTFGLDGILNGNFSKLMIVRQPAAVGEELGYMKGTKEAKMEPWFKMVADNFPGGNMQLLERMMQDGQVEFEVPAYMQGRSLESTFILVTEAQYNTEAIKMLGTRVGKGSVIVFEGDTEQVYNKRYKGDGNGFDRMLRLMPGHPKYGHLFGSVTLTECVRSEVASMFAEVL